MLMAATWCVRRSHLPGIYSRAFVEGRLTEERLDNFRQVDGKGDTSCPHLN